MVRNLWRFVRFLAAKKSFISFRLFSLEKLCPDLNFGKVDNSTELIVSPFKQNNSEPNISNSTTSKENSLYERLFNKDNNQGQQPLKTNNVIDSRTLDNVSEKSSIDDESYSSESTKSLETIHYEEKSYCRKSKLKLNSQIRSFKLMLAEISSQDRKVFNFRVLPRCMWNNNNNNSQMCDAYVSKPFQQDSLTIFALNYDHLNDNDERVSREYYVNLKIDEKIDKNSKDTFATIELNDILMAKLKISKYSRVTLTNKKTVLNFFEKIELIPTSNNKVNKQEIIESFKEMLIKSAPLLINQDQIFKLCGGTVLVSVKIFPESFKYCVCDAEILRERKIFVSDQTKDLEILLKATDEISSIKLAGLQRKKSVIQTNELVNIVEDCVKSITIKNCRNEMNQLRKLGNILIMGKYIECSAVPCQLG